LPALIWLTAPLDNIVDCDPYRITGRNTKALLLRIEADPALGTPIPVAEAQSRQEGRRASRENSSIAEWIQKLFFRDEISLIGALDDSEGFSN